MSRLAPPPACHTRPLPPRQRHPHEPVASATGAAGSSGATGALARHAATARERHEAALSPQLHAGRARHLQHLELPPAESEQVLDPRHVRARDGFGELGARVGEHLVALLGWA